MRYILALSVMVMLGPGAALAQDAPCPLYRVNVSALPVSTDPGGPANRPGLFDGETVCVQRKKTVEARHWAFVKGRPWVFIAYKMNGLTARTSVEGWTALSYLQGLSSAEAQVLSGIAPRSLLGVGYELIFNGQGVNGPETKFWTREQGIENCAHNKQKEPGVKVDCLYDGIFLAVPGKS